MPVRLPDKTLSQDSSSTAFEMSASFEALGLRVISTRQDLGSLWKTILLAELQDHFLFRQQSLCMTQGPLDSACLTDSNAETVR